MLNNASLHSDFTMEQSRRVTHGSSIVELRTEALPPNMQAPRVMDCGVVSACRASLRNMTGVGLGGQHVEQSSQLLKTNVTYSKTTLSQGFMGLSGTWLIPSPVHCTTQYNT